MLPIAATVAPGSERASPLFTMHTVAERERERGRRLLLTRSSGAGQRAARPPQLQHSSGCSKPSSQVAKYPEPERGGRDQPRCPVNACMCATTCTFSTRKHAESNNPCPVAPAQKRVHQTMDFLAAAARWRTMLQRASCTAAWTCASQAHHGGTAARRWHSSPSSAPKQRTSWSPWTGCIATIGCTPPRRSSLLL